MEDSQPGKTCCDPKYDISNPSHPNLETLDAEIEYDQFMRVPYLWPALGLKADLPVPVPLHTCRESRGVALKFYKLGFATLGAKPQVYFNFELDTLYLDEESFDDPDSFDGIIGGALFDFCHEERRRIQNVALGTFLLQLDYDNQAQDSCVVMSSFGNVKSVTFRIHEYQEKSLNKGTALEKSSLAFIDPIHMNQRVYMFQNPDFHIDHVDHELPRQLWDELDIMDPLEIDMVRDDIFAKGYPTWPMPLIRHRIITTSAIKANFEQLKQQYERTSDCRCYEDDDRQNYLSEEIGPRDIADCRSIWG